MANRLGGFRLSVRMPIRDNGQRGAEIIEKVLLLFLSALILAFGIALIIKQPSLLEKTLPVVVFGAATGLLAWSGKQVIAGFNLRSKMLILELLSDGRPRTRQEIRKVLRWRAPVYQDALGELVCEGKIAINGRRYILQVSEPGKKVILASH